MIVYCNLIRQKYKHVPIIAGGIEASLRRMAHYDYWSDSLRRSILLESGADLVSYGMGERSIVAIADALDAGMPVKDITYIPGTVCKVRSLDEISDYTVLPDYESICKVRKNMRRASIFSTAIQIRFLENGWWSLILRTALSCRTRLQNR